MGYRIWLDRGAPVLHPTQLPPKIDETARTVTFLQDPSKPGSTNHTISVNILVGFVELGFPPPNVRIRFHNDVGERFDQDFSSQSRSEVRIGGKKFYRFERPAGQQSDYPGAIFAQINVDEILDLLSGQV